MLRVRGAYFLGQLAVDLHDKSHLADPGDS